MTHRNFFVVVFVGHCVKKRKSLSAKSVSCHFEIKLVIDTIPMEKNFLKKTFKSQLLTDKSHDESNLTQYF